MNLTVPEGYYLVEFFGTHDFGWLKQDATLPMTSDGSLSEFGGKLGMIDDKFIFTMMIIVIMIIITIATITIIFSLF